MKRLLLITLLIASGVTYLTAAARHHSMIVHEWGTFTTIAGKNGASLDWRPLVAANDLPSFVYHFDQPDPTAGLRYLSNGKAGLTALVRMETPVIYFYTAEPATVAVRVGFPQGKVTEWYPRASSASNGIDWGTVQLLPKTNAVLRHDELPSHYYAARATDSAVVRVCGQKGNEFEKFLFYRGVGNFGLPVTATLQGDKLRIGNLGGLGQLVIFDNRQGKTAYAVHQVSATELTVPRPISGQTDNLMNDLRSLLVSAGLYEKEARAMVETWRDSWFEDGLRVFYVLPREQTDAVLPLTLNPPPSALVRILVGRIEVITPELEADVLVHPAAHGRFAEPVLKQLLARTTDADSRARIEEILKQPQVN